MEEHVWAAELNIFIYSWLFLSSEAATFWYWSILKLQSVPWKPRSHICEYILRWMHSLPVASEIRAQLCWTLTCNTSLWMWLCVTESIHFNFCPQRKRITLSSHRSSLSGTDWFTGVIVCHGPFWCIHWNNERHSTQINHNKIQITQNCILSSSGLCCQLNYHDRTIEIN